MLHTLSHSLPPLRAALPHILPPRSIFRATPPLSRAQNTLSNIFAADSSAVSVASITSAGIELSDGLVLRGPSILLNGRAFLWNSPPAGGSWVGWGKEVWNVFEVVVPRPEILLFGTGKSILLPPPSVRTHLNGLGIQLDFMDTRNACSTYNLLLEEGRRVAAALLPLEKQVPWTAIPKE